MGQPRPRPANPNPNQVELQSKRLEVQKQVTRAMIAVTILFACFTVAIVVVLGVSLQQMRSALDEIAKVCDK